MSGRGDGPADEAVQGASPATETAAFNLTDELREVRVVLSDAADRLSRLEASQAS